MTNNVTLFQPKRVSDMIQIRSLINLVSDLIERITSNVVYRSISVAAGSDISL